MFQSLISFSVLLLCILQCDCARILAVYSFPILRYQEVYRVLTEELLKRGHEVVVVTTDPAYTDENSPRNLTEIDVHDISYHIWEELDDSIKIALEDPSKSKLPYEIAETIHKLFLLQMHSEDFQKLISDGSKFDLILLEEGISSNLILSHIFKAPTILVGSYGSDLMSVASAKKLYTSILHQRSNNLPIWEKIYEIYKVYSFEKFMGDLEDDQNELLEAIIGYNKPTLRELHNKVDVFLSNDIPMWEGIKPMSPNIVTLGRLQTKPEKVLPQDLQIFLNASTSGVIYINVGANIKSSLLPPELIRTMVKVMAELSYDVLWKWDGDELPGQSQNIKIVKQLPQLDVLKHPKIKLFINDGDLQSSDEAISAGVPVIGLPFMSNQIFNAENYERFKIGLKLDINTLSEEQFKYSVHNVIRDQSYRDNTIQLRSLMYDQRQRPLTRALWWIDYVLKFKGTTHLRSPATNLHWTEYYEVELIFFVIFLYIMAMVLLMIFCYCLFLISRSCYTVYSRRNMKNRMYFPH